MPRCPAPPVSDCRRLLMDADVADLPRLIRRLRSDKRAGVIQAVELARRRLNAHRAEVRRVTALHDAQRRAHDTGHAVVAGMDEVGLGALAGPVTAGAVILDVETLVEGLDDSKRLTPERREELAHVLRRVVTAAAVVHVPSTTIDRIGIAAATRRAMRLALEALGTPVDHVLVDGNGSGLPFSHTPVVGGDSRCACIAAASILAKVARDEIMRTLHRRYPAYGFREHKGYTTERHLLAIDRFGPSSEHRRSYAPCREDLTLF